ncbi:YL1 nuclear protein-domain-containing protein [Absidia repens]|uniref:YL1 nuclear protein-domain-containing protein n=1 Tax=Absidia repens TaxID=90262 RepID=A0A1X2J1J4_9FUNG|nr:YL1 nuclear protein-domain-containing protein [Absidia repens]
MSFVQQREKRANAGSRMRALLDKEADMEELFELDESEDEAFSGVDDEQVDTVDSDFDMDESEGEAEQEQLAEEEEKRIQRAERQAKRPNIRQQQFLQKSSVSQVPATSHTALPTTANKPGRPTKKKQHNKQQQSADLSSRQSLRTKTILNRMHVEEQIRESESKKARLPKRIRPEVRHLTQEELLAEAAITEEENRVSLEQWQQKEAERQAKAKVKVKRGIQGPFIRYHSFTDGATKERPQQRKLVMIMDGDHGNTTQVDITDPMVLDFHYRRDVQECDISAKNLITFFPGDDPAIQKATAGDDNATSDDYGDDLETNKLKHVKTEGLTDRELDRLDRIPQLASWADRSARTIKPLPCPITGKEARYREPMTHTPYSDAPSYSNIIDCMNHRYIWSPSLGLYIGNEFDKQGAEGVPDGWERMIEGKRPEEDDWNKPFPQWMATASKESSPPLIEEQQQNDTKPTRRRQRQRT